MNHNRFIKSRTNLEFFPHNLTNEDDTDIKLCQLLKSQECRQNIGFNIP